MNEIGIFKNGIDYLPPGKKIEIGLFITHAMGNAGEKPLEIITTYKDSSKEEYRETYILDIGKWESFQQEQEPFADASRALGNIAWDLSSILRELSRRTRV